MLTPRDETVSEILGLGNKSNNLKNDLFEVGFTSPKLHKTFRSEGGGEFPHVVIPHSEDIEDFFAVIDTYYQAFNPVSAFMHILGKETSILMDEISKPNELMSDLKNPLLFRRAMLGAAIGESIIANYRNSQPESVGGYEFCRNSLSFMLCRSRLIHNDILNPEFITTRWSKLKEFSWLETPVLSAFAINIIYRLFSNRVQPNLLVNKISDLMIHDDWTHGALDKELSKLYPSVKEFFPVLYGPYDSRISGLTSIINAIQSNSRGQQEDEIAVAYFVNALLPGSYRHHGILRRLIDFYPNAMIWYGFFASISDTQLKSSTFSTLILKLERDLTEPFSLMQRPKADVSYEEFVTLVRGDFQFQSLNSILSNTVLVSLVPGVDMYVSVDKGSGKSTSVSNRAQELEEVNNKVSKLLEEALFNIKKLYPISSSSSYQATPKKSRARKDK